MKTAISYKKMRGSIALMLISSLILTIAGGCSKRYGCYYGTIQPISEQKTNFLASSNQAEILPHTFVCTDHSIVTGAN